MKRAFTLLEALIVITIVMVLAAFLTPTICRSSESARRASCISNLKQIGLGFIQYTQDYDERFPPARVSTTVGWKDVIMPYIKSEQVFQCPSAPHAETASTDYFYNRRLARFRLKKLDSSLLTVLAGDGGDDALAWNSITQLPRSWNATEESPSRRHLDRANYLFADGHVKSVKFSNIRTSSPIQDIYPSFATR